MARRSRHMSFYFDCGTRMAAGIMELEIVVDQKAPWNRSRG